MVVERRNSERLSVVWKATLTRLNGEQLPGSTDNISAQGMNVILSKALVVGEPVRIDVVSRCTGRLCYFTLEGVIVYNRALESNLGNAVGLRLLEPSEEYLQFLQRYGMSAQVLIAS